jgi:antirestriction protein ArdC
MILIPQPPFFAGLSGYVAEMTSALLGADLGLPTAHIDDHAAYIGSWLAVLRKDPAPS